MKIFRQRHLPAAELPEVRKDRLSSGTHPALYRRGTRERYRAVILRLGTNGGRYSQI